MPVNVKDYLNSMSQTSSRQTTTASSSVNLKTQALLSQLIEAIAYANSIDFRKKTLNAQVTGTDRTGKEVLNNMKAQEALIKQLSEGQKLSTEQNKKLTDAIDKFYTLSGNQEVDYKKFAAALEKYALQKNMPEAVKTRLINDSRDAHIIGTSDKTKEGPILPIIKKIKYLLEDSAESTKQFGKKFFVTLDEFKEGILGAFSDLGDAIADGSFMNQIFDAIKSFGMGFMLLQGLFKQGDFKAGIIFKQFSNIQKIFKVAKNLGNVSAKSLSGIPDLLKSFKTLGNIPKFIGKLGLGKGLFGGLSKVSKLGIKGLKKIPLLGTAISVWMGIERWKQKDYAGALIEFGSGVAAAFPGVGTLVSILLDLINIGRDTGFFKKAGDTASNFIANLSDEQKLAIPVFGQIFGIKKAIELWQSGDKLGALKMAGMALSPLGPIAGIASIIGDLATGKLGKENLNEPKGSGQAGGQFGSASPASGRSFGSRLANAATSIGGGVSNSTGKCALKVGDALERVIGKEANAYRGNAWQWESKLNNSKYFNKAGVATSDKDLKNLPAGSIALWRKQSKHPYGHIEIADGKGRLISDFARPANLGLYRSNPAGIKPIIYTPKDVPVAQLASLENAQGQDITSTSSDSFSGTSETAEAQPSMSFDDMMAQFNKFNEDIVAGANTQSNNAGMKVASSYNANMTQGATVSPAQQQNVQYTSNNGDQQTMTKEIEDTDIALLNSILFS